MKPGNNSPFLVLLPALVFFMTAGVNECQKNTPDNASDTSWLNDYSKGTGTMVDSGLEYASQEIIDTVFKLDFSPLAPEPEQEPELISDAPSQSNQVFKIPAQAASQGQSIGGGLRKQLSDYQIEYLNQDKIAARIAAIEKAQAAANQTNAGIVSASKEPLTVIDWGPRGFFSSAVQRPSLFVIFSEPMVSLASLGIPSDNSPFVSITPPLKGQFRWYGTSFLSFEADEPCQPQQNYQITVKPKTVSLSGKTISGLTSFSFFTEALKMDRVVPGEDFRQKVPFSFSNYKVPPEAAKQLSLYFNYPVAVKDIQNFLGVTAKDRQNPSAFLQERSFTLKQAAPQKINVYIDGEIAFNNDLTVTLKQGAKSANATLGTSSNQSISVSTPGPFTVENSSRFYLSGESSNLITIYFSERLNEKTVTGNIRIQPTIKIGPDNIDVSGTVLEIKNLPVKYEDVFTLILETGIEDMYGRKLQSPFTKEIKVPKEPPPEGSATFLTYSWNNRDTKMLEAQFDPRFLFEYINVADTSKYSLATVKNPYRSADASNKQTFTLNTQPHRRWFAEMDLKPFLNQNKRGFVYFNASVDVLTSDYYEGSSSYKTKTSNRTNSVVLQITDLGITVRSGFNKTAVLVTSLATGKPIANARVRLIPSYRLSSEADIDSIEYLAESKTDDNGMAVFTEGWGDEGIGVYAEKDGDKAVFEPYGHNTWAFNIENDRPSRARQVKPVTFMFTDRGLYKPGEILSFRGVDRSLAVGNYLIYQGKYTITLETDSYRDSTTIATIEGETSESGSFYGSITLPDDLNPEAYVLSYRREGKPDNSASIPVQVAFFERLKFEASITPPVGTLYTGDTVNMTLKASYLSGGSLSGASYEEHWDRSIAWFRPPSPEAKGFFFGPYSSWEGSSSLSSREGVLGGNGVASLSQKSVETGITGAAYRYTVDVQITDISNQMIAARKSVVVHPAKFYLGLASPAARGFPKTGQELSFRYIALTPSGEKAGKPDWLATGSDAEKIKVEFLREEWHLVQQKGVSGYVYDDYVKETITENSQTVQLKSDGTVKFTPSKPGFYIVRVSAKDSSGRTVLTERGFYVTGSGYRNWDMNRSDEIKLTPDQEMYNPGDTAQLLMQSALPGGYYLITVEREGIFKEEIKHLEEGTTVLEIPIARNYVPVVYVSVASYSVRTGPPRHEYGEIDLDKPKGYYGVTALKVNPRVKAFSVTIEDAGNRIYRPGETVTLTLKAERNGKAIPGAELALMAVDRGVLDLINYHVPNPVDYFYNNWRFPLSVVGGDSRSYLLDPVTYSIKNLAGGDSDEEKLEERKDFNPTAVFQPMLKTGADGRVKATFKLPDNLTTYRVTIFGVIGDLFALKESEIAARNRINVQQVLPRRLRERDTAEAGVLISNMDNASHKVTVSLAVSPGSGVTENGLVKEPGTAAVDGAAERSITLKGGENGVVYFDIAALQEGYINCNFTVRSDVLNEKLITELFIEKPYVMETVTTLGTIAADASSASEGIVIPGWADNGAGSLSVSLDATRLGLMDAAVTYLFNYPYGCLEQRSSAVLPLVIFGEYIDALNLKSKVKDPKKTVEAEIKSWARSQLSDGGFPYWPDGLTSNFYVSTRIAHILALAQQKNYSVPSSIDVNRLAVYLNNEFLKTLRNSSGALNYTDSYLQAYHLYVFSLLGKTVEPSRLAEIAARPNIDAGTLAYLGMTYRNLKRNSEAADIGEKIRNLIRSTTRGAEITDPRENSNGFYYSFYGGKTEQLALVLEFYVNQYPGDALNGRLLYSLLSLKRAGGYWESTAVTVRILSAVAALIKAENLEKVNVNGVITLAGTELFKDKYQGLGAKPTGKTFNFKTDPLLKMKRDSALPMNITRSGTGALYYTASLQYAIPSEMHNFRDEGLSIFITYYDIATGKEISGTALQSGKAYQAKIRLSSGRDRTYVALRAPVPSGAEILDSTFVTTPRYSETETDNDEDSYYYWYDPRRPSSMVIMDNEVRYFWDVFQKGDATVQFQFRCSRRGVYPTPPVQAECMYESEIFGRTRGLLYTIE